MEASRFQNNSAMYGGILRSWSSNIKIGSSIFTRNGSPIGAVIYIMQHADGSNIQYHNTYYFLIDSNSADRYAVIYLSDSHFRGHSENVTFSSNLLGSLVAFNSNITFTGYASFVNNQPSQTTADDFQEGGAITLFQSDILMEHAIFNIIMWKMVEQYVLPRVNS